MREAVGCGRGRHSGPPYRTKPDSDRRSSAAGWWPTSAGCDVKQAHLGPASPCPWWLLQSPQSRVCRAPCQQECRGGTSHGEALHAAGLSSGCMDPTRPITHVSAASRTPVPLVQRHP